MDIAGRTTYLLPSPGFVGKALIAGAVGGAACALHLVVRQSIDKLAVTEASRNSLRHCSIVAISGAAALANRLAGESALKSLALGALVGIILGIIGRTLPQAVTAPAPPVRPDETPAPLPSTETVTDVSAASSIGAPEAQTSEPPQEEEQRPPTPPPFPNSDPGSPGPESDMTSSGSSSIDEVVEPVVEDSREVLMRVLGELYMPDLDMRDRDMPDLESFDQEEAAEEHYQADEELENPNADTAPVEETVLRPPSPKIGHICKEIIDTERTFLVQMGKYQQVLKELLDDKQVSLVDWQRACLGLENLLNASQDVLRVVSEHGPAAAYGDDELMNRYFAGISDLAANCAFANQLLRGLKDPTRVIQAGQKQVNLCDAAVLPVQRGPRHQLLLLELAKKDEDFAPLYHILVDRQAAVNYRLKVAQLDGLLEALKLLGRNKDGKLQMHDFASNITYNVVERKKLRKKASETVFNAGVTTTNDSSRVLHSILDFLTDCAESERAKVTWCVNLLTATKWWKELTRREEALQLKLDHLQGLCKPPA